MTPRSIRRAAERKANKLARKSIQQNSVMADTLPAIEEVQEPVAAIAIPSAADANIRLSAITSTLTGQTTLLPTTGAGQFDQLIRDYEREYKPVGLQESQLVQTLAENNWRMRRIMALEMGIFAQGRIEFAVQFAAHKAEIRDSLLEVHTFLTYEKQIRGLQLQEARLSRRAGKATAELRILQQERRQREQQAQRAQETSAKQTLPPAHAPQPAGQNGFVFSNPQNTSHFAPKQSLQNESPAASLLQVHAEAA